jgi:hypothetical protein
MPPESQNSARKRPKIFYKVTLTIGLSMINKEKIAFRIVKWPFPRRSLANTNYLILLLLRR